MALFNAAPQRFMHAVRGWGVGSVLGVRLFASAARARYVTSMATRDAQLQHVQMPSVATGFLLQRLVQHLQNSPDQGYAIFEDALGEGTAARFEHLLRSDVPPTDASTASVHRCPIVENSMRALFASYDKHGFGMISQKDFSQLVRDYGIADEPDEIRDVMSKAGIANINAVGYEEFRTFALQHDLLWSGDSM